MFIIISSVLMIRCIVYLQLSTLLRPTNNPWQPDMRHYLHPAQWPHQDWLRSAPSRAFYVTTTSRGHSDCGVLDLPILISAVLQNRKKHLNYA